MLPYPGGGYLPKLGGTYLGQGYLPWGTSVLTWPGEGVPTLGYPPPSSPGWGVPTLAWRVPNLVGGVTYLKVPPIWTLLGGTYLGQGVPILGYPSPIWTWPWYPPPPGVDRLKTLPSPILRMRSVKIQSCKSTALLRSEIGLTSEQKSDIQATL